ncbi:MAG TPA: RcpC/CpaB family pilus assembly protein, partial [Rhodothermales bacterium]|nr:RcpC/CpaB family pilus assembly protein [Rhodothermales bacterium]
LLPGDRVDVVAAYRIKNAPGLAENEYILRIETFLQNVEVLSVAQSAQQASAGLKTDTVGEGEGETYYSGRLPDDLEDQPGAISVTVALSPDEVAAVVSMQQRADKVWLTERAFGDTTVVDLTPHEVVLVE